MAGPKHRGPTTWEKGKSGNPGGRAKRVGPNGETLPQLARVHSPAAFERLRQLIDSPEPEIAYKACIAIIDRGHGKPIDYKPEGEDQMEGKGKNLAEELLSILAKNLPD